LTDAEETRKRLADSVHREITHTSEEWVKKAEGMTSLPHITLATVYLKRTGFMLASPPLEDLADILQADLAAAPQIGLALAEERTGANWM
jgi:hypothetical protein